MKLQDQLITLEQAKRLVELGVNTHSIFMICVALDGFVITSRETGVHLEASEYFPAYTVAELGVMLPTAYDSMRLHEGWRVYDEDGNDGTGKDEVFKTEAQARGALLIHLLETGIITAEQCNLALAA